MLLQICKNHETNKNHNYGFITLQNREIAQKAIDVMKGRPYGKRKLDVKFARSKVIKKPKFIAQPNWIVPHGSLNQNYFLGQPKVKFFYSETIKFIKIYPCF